MYVSIIVIIKTKNLLYVMCTVKKSNNLHILVVFILD